MRYTNKPYCQPLNTNPKNNGVAVAIQLTHLLNTLEDSVNESHVDGQVLNDITLFKYKLIDDLKDYGWRVSYDSKTHQFTVLPRTPEPR
jgi:hypothetical protein